MSPTTQTESVVVLPTTRAAGKSVAKFVTEFKAALKAGNAIAEAVTIAGAALNDLAPVLTQIPAIEAEAVGDPVDEVMTVALNGRDLYAALKS